MWSPLTEEILPACLDPSELESVTALRAQCMQDPVAQVLLGVSTELRTRIASGGRTRLQGGPADIPDALMPAATALVRYRLLTRFALEVSDARKAEWDQANQTLRELSSGAYVITDDRTAPIPAPRYAGRPIRWGPRSRKGIM